MTRSARRGPWLPDEDHLLIQLVRSQGPNNWVRISQQMQHRSPKQCRERYHQNLKSSLKHDPITAAEGEMIEQMVAELGKRWAEIARRLGNRSDNAVKNWWNGSMNRRRRTSADASTTTGVKSVGSRLRPIPFENHQYIPQPRTVDAHCWPPRPTTLQISVLAHVHDGLPAGSSPCASAESRTGCPPRSPYSKVGSYELRPELPPLKSSTFERRSSVFDRPLISPALSDQSNSLRNPPSLVSDSYSTCSISPKTVTTPRTAASAPADISWQQRYTPQQYQLPLDPVLPKTSGTKDARMNVSNLVV